MSGLFSRSNKADPLYIGIYEIQHYFQTPVIGQYNILSGVYFKDPL